MGKILSDTALKGHYKMIIGYLEKNKIELIYKLDKRCQKFEKLYKSHGKNKKLLKERILELRYVIRKLKE